MEKSRILLILFATAGIANVVGHTAEMVDLARYSKPLLMPLLLFFVYEKSKGAVTQKTLILAGALIFSWLGDLALMESNLFLPGVGLFLLAQGLYIYLFRKSTYNSLRVSYPLLGAGVAYATILFYLVLPSAGSLIIPIIIYGLVLLTMTLMALHRKGKTVEESYKLVAIGAILFLISDSVLAYSKFVSVFFLSQTLVMLTYILAQYFIAVGIIKHPS